jgi:hypothetical protein
VSTGFPRKDLDTRGSSGWFAAEQRASRGLRGLTSQIIPTTVLPDEASIRF